MSKKKFIEEGYKLAHKISEKTKKKMREGKLKMKSNDPDIQKMIDDVVGKPPKVDVDKAFKETVLSPKTQLRNMLSNKKPIKPKKMAGGGLATKGLGKAFLNRKR